MLMQLVLVVTEIPTCLAGQTNLTTPSTLFKLETHQQYLLPQLHPHGIMLPYLMDVQLKLQTQPKLV